MLFTSAVHTLSSLFTSLCCMTLSQAVDVLHRSLWALLIWSLAVLLSNKQSKLTAQVSFFSLVLDPLLRSYLLSLLESHTCAFCHYCVSYNKGDKRAEVNDALLVWNYLKWDNVFAMLPVFKGFNICLQFAQIGGTVDGTMLGITWCTNI